MKDRTTAALLALFLGTFGIHRFYVKQNGLGITYLVLAVVSCGILTPILGIIDAILWLIMSDADFNRKFNAKYANAPQQVHFHVHGNNNENQVIIQQSGSETYPKPQSTVVPPTQISPRKRQQKKVKQPTIKQQAIPPTPVTIHNPAKTKGVAKFKEYDFSGAKNEFEKALKIQPNDIAIHFNLGCCYSMEEDIEKSLEHLSRAVELGFKGFDRIQNHDALSFLRSHDEFLEFEKNNYRWTKVKELDLPKEDDLLVDIEPEEETLDLNVPKKEKEVVILSPTEIENKHAQNKSKNLFDEFFGDKEVPNIEENKSVEPLKFTENSHNNDVIAQLKELASLRDNGILTEEEFQLQKKKLLG